MLLWFDSKLRYGITFLSVWVSRDALWFDSKLRYGITVELLIIDNATLWFDSKLRYGITTWSRVRFLSRCGLIQN